MNEVWNLDSIYRGFDDPALEADLQSLREMAGDYNTFAASLDTMEPLEGLKQGIDWQERLTRRAMKLLD